MAVLSLADIIAQSYVPANSVLRGAGNPAPGFLANMGMEALPPGGSTGGWGQLALAQRGGVPAVPGSAIGALGPGAPAPLALGPGSLGQLLPGAGAPVNQAAIAAGAPAGGLPAGALGQLSPAAKRFLELDAAEMSLRGTAPGAGGATAGAASLADDVAGAAGKAPGPMFGPNLPAGVVNMGGRTGKLGSLFAGMQNGGGLSQYLSRMVPTSMASGIGGGLAGLVAQPVLGAAGDLLIGGEATDPGFSWGGLLKAAGAGAGAGAIGAGIATGGAGAAPGALLGGLLSGGSYLLSEKAAAANEVDIPGKAAEMRQFVREYNLDPQLADQVIGQFSLMAKIYEDQGAHAKLKPLVEESMTTLAGLIGQQGPQAQIDAQRIDPSVLAQMSQTMTNSLAPFYEQIPGDSPYKVAALQQLGNIPRSLYMDNQQQVSQLQQLLSGQGMAQATAASGSMSPDAIKKMTAAGVAM